MSRTTTNQMIREFARVLDRPASAAPSTNLTPFVTTDLRFDIAAISADAKARYGAKLEFISRYAGAPKRYWQWRQARQAVRQAWREAKGQMHTIVLDRARLAIEYLPAERERMADLRADMGCAPVTLAGNADFKAMAGEYSQISLNVQQRAYFAVIRQARGEV